MKIKLAIPILLAVLMTAGCAGRHQNKWESFRTEFRDRESISLKAQVTSDYGDKVFAYTLDYHEQEGSGTITVTEPEIIKGLTAKVTDNGASIEYEGTALDTGALDAEGRNPISAIPALLQAAAEGHLETLSKERLEDSDAIAAKIGLSEQTFAVIWLDMETGLPLHAEICTNNKSIIFCDFLEWNLN